MEWVKLNMAFASIICAWLVLYATRRTFKDVIVRLALMYIVLVAMCCLVEFALLQQVDLYLCTGIAVVFGTIGLLFAFFATRHATKKVKKEEKK